MQKKNESALFEKIPPQNLEAERAVIASILIDPDVISKVVEQINVDDFYQESHKIILTRMLSLYDKKEPIDLVTVNNALKEDSFFQEAGGAVLLTEITDSIPTSANVDYYLKIVKNKGLVRRLIHTCTDIIGDAYQTSDDEIPDLVDKAETRIFDIAKQKVREDLVPIKPVLNQTLNFIEKRIHDKGKFTGVPTGFYDLDKMTGGLQPSDLIIIAARPSMGKTAFCLNIMENVSIRYKLGVIFFSLEMSKQQLCQRLISSHSRIDSNSLRTGELKPDAFMRLTTGVAKLSEAKIYLDDTPSISTLEIRAKARRLIAREKIDLIIIDYLQLINSSTDRKNENRTNEIAAISRSLKALARELDVPVIAISQLSRSVEARGGDHRPRLSDLRDSGAIEQDADIVSFIYRDEYYNSESELKGQAEIIIAKHRNGPTGSVHLMFNSTQTRFDNLEQFRDAG